MNAKASKIRTEILRRYIADGGNFAFRASGCSMLSAIRPSDLLHVGQAHSFHPGDVLVFDQDGRLVVHRLIGIVRQPGEQQLIFRGDNQRQSDAAVRPEAVLGRVLRIERSRRTIPIDGFWGRLNRRLAFLTFFGRPIMPWLRFVVLQVRIRSWCNIVASIFMPHRG